MKPEVWNWIKQSTGIVAKGITNRMDSPNGKIKIYKCGSVIRIDIKEELKDEVN